MELACGFVCRFSRCLNTSVAECFVFRSLELHEHLLRVFNLMLEDGHVEEGWKQIIFSMIAITGDPTNPGNWRPLAIPNITTHIFFLLVWLQTFETNIGSSAIQRPNWVSFFCWCG